MKHQFMACSGMHWMICLLFAINWNGVAFLLAMWTVVTLDTVNTTLKLTHPWQPFDPCFDNKGFFLDDLSSLHILANKQVSLRFQVDISTTVNNIVSRTCSLLHAACGFPPGCGCLPTFFPGAALFSLHACPFVIESAETKRFTLVTKNGRFWSGCSPSFLPSSLLCWNLRASSVIHLENRGCWAVFSRTRNWRASWISRMIMQLSSPWLIRHLDPWDVKEHDISSGTKQTNCN